MCRKRARLTTSLAPFERVFRIAQHSIVVALSHDFMRRATLRDNLSPLQCHSGPTVRWHEEGLERHGASGFTPADSSSSIKRLILPARREAFYFV